MPHPQPTDSLAEQTPARLLRASAGPALALVASAVLGLHLAHRAVPAATNVPARERAAPPVSRTASVRAPRPAIPLVVQETADNRQALDWLEVEREHLGEESLVRVPAAE